MRNTCFLTAEFLLVLFPHPVDCEACCSRKPTSQNFLVRLWPPLFSYKPRTLCRKHTGERTYHSTLLQRMWRTLSPCLIILYNNSQEFILFSSQVFLFFDILLYFYPAVTLWIPFLGTNKRSSYLITGRKQKHRTCCCGVRVTGDGQELLLSRSFFSVLTATLR